MSLVIMLTMFKVCILACLKDQNLLCHQSIDHVNSRLFKAARNQIWHLNYILKFNCNFFALLDLSISSFKICKSTGTKSGVVPLLIPTYLKHVLQL